MDAVRSRLTWDDVEDLSGRLAGGVPRPAGEAFDRIVAIARGGLVPAALVASALEIKRVETVQVLLYDGDERQDSPQRLGPRPAVAGPSGDPRRTLVVDEIVDSGRTVAFVRSLLPLATYAALVARNAGSPRREASGLHAVFERDASGPVWVAGTVETDAWILFPWSPPEDRRAAGADR